MSLRRRNCKSCGTELDYSKEVYGDSDGNLSYCSYKCGKKGQLREGLKMNRVNEATIREACNRLAEILIAKNNDYGNSVEEQFNEYGPMSIAIRLDDKLRRFKNLTIESKEQMVSSEKPIDTLLDTAGYSILGLICLDKE